MNWTRQAPRSFLCSSKLGVCGDPVFVEVFLSERVHSGISVSLTAMHYTLGILQEQQQSRHPSTKRRATMAAARSPVAAATSSLAA